MKRLAPLLAAVCLLAFAGSAGAHGFPAGRALLTARSLARAADVPAACPAGVPVQTIHVVNDTSVSPSTVARWEAATEWEANSYLVCFWHTPPISFVNDPPLPPFDPSVTTPSITVPTLFLEPSRYLGGNGDVGDHDIAYVPCAFGDCLAVPYMIVTPTGPSDTSVTFSHEVFESLVDPAGTTLDPHGNPIEVCDGAFVNLEYHGIYLSSFNTPAAFGLGSGQQIWPKRDLTIP